MARASSVRPSVRPCDTFGQFRSQFELCAAESEGADADERVSGFEENADVETTEEEEKGTNIERKTRRGIRRMTT